MGTSRRAEALALLGIAQRAGAIVKGTDAARRSLRRGEIRLLLTAEDAAEAQLRKTVSLARAQGVACRKVGTRVELGASVGSGPLTVVGVVGNSFPEQLEERLGSD